MTDTPYHVGKWLAETLNPGERLTDGEILKWAGRAANSICSLALVDDTTPGLQIEFEGLGMLLISDKGQSCCERRYMTCDDDLSTFVGARILQIDLAS